jgi:hypothetical protein
MAFARTTPLRTSKPRGESGGPVIGVGRKVFVHWPALTRPLEQVPLMDVDGKALLNDLVDGQQVEILAWRPRSRNGLTYHIRRVADGLEGWLVAHHLRPQSAVGDGREG